MVVPTELKHSDRLSWGSGPPSAALTRHQVNISLRSKNQRPLKNMVTEGVICKQNSNSSYYHLAEEEASLQDTFVCFCT